MAISTIGQNGLTVPLTSNTITSASATALTLQSAGTTAVTIDTSQRVGIGTTSPTSPLQVNTAGVNTTVQINSTDANGGYGANIALNNTGTGGRQYALFSTSNADGDVGGGKLKFYDLTASATRMLIDSSGNLFVGTTSNFSADKMCLNFTSGINGLGIRDDSNTSGAYYAVFRNSANQVIGSITRVTTTNAVAYNTTSDQRLKSNIADASPVLNKLMNVKVRQFDWTEGNLHQDAGFIAQELSTVLSGVVTEGKTEDDLWQLDYARLTPYLTKAIQEQQALITAQAETINALTARIEALENK